MAATHVAFCGYLEVDFISPDGLIRCPAMVGLSADISEI